MRRGKGALCRAQHREPYVATWRAGELLVRGKGPRLERLPLASDVGEALVDYLREGRPRSACRQLFLRSRAPLGGLSSEGVSAVVRAACTRAGLAPVGAHRLRHTLASELLRAGASLPEIAQALRHRQLKTTAIYAACGPGARCKTLALPWPEVKSMSVLRKAAARVPAGPSSLSATSSKAQGHLLLQFVEYPRAAGRTEYITTELALAWARQPADASQLWLAPEALRSCAASRATCVGLDPRTEVPANDLLPARSAACRALPLLGGRDRGG